MKNLTNEFIISGSYFTNLTTYIFLWKYTVIINMYILIYTDPTYIAGLQEPLIWACTNISKCMYMHLAPDLHDTSYLASLHLMASSPPTQFNYCNLNLG